MSLNSKNLLLPFIVSMGLYSAHTLGEVTEKKNGNVITIVSQKRLQDEISVPISVSTLTTEDLQFSGANDLNDLSNLSPNFSTNGQEGYQAAIYMRGVGTWSRNIGFDTRVGVYLDGIYLGQSTSLNQAMMGLQQAEVLRGPQGTLFGKNTVAGAVNLISIKPDISDNEGRIGFEIGNYGLQQFSGRFNLPLSDTTAVQLTVMDHQFDGQYYNIYNDQAVGSRDTNAYRVQLSHEFSNSFDLYFSFDDSTAKGSWLNGEALSDSFGNFAIPVSDPAAADYIINANVTAQNNYQNNGINLTLSFTADSGVTLRSITGYRDSSSFFISDTDYSPLDFLYVDFADDYQNTSQEFQWISADDDSFEYLTGLFFYEQKGKTLRNANPGVHIVALNPAFGLPYNGLSCGEDPVALLNPLTWCLEPGKTVFNQGQVDVSSWAAYGNASYRIAKNTHLDFGLRYTFEKKAAQFELGTNNGGVNGLIFGVGLGRVDDSYEDSFVSHSIGLRHQSGKNNYYLKWSTGFKSAGFNLDFIDQVALDSGAGFDKETVNSIEAGVKGRYMDKRLKFTLALFSANYKDYQVNQFLPLGDNASTISIQNVDEALASGLELGLNYQLTDNFSVEFNYGYLDTTFGNFPGGGMRLPAGGNADATGNTLPYAPKHSVSSSIKYETGLTTLGGTTLIALLGHSYASDQYTNTWNVREFILGAGEIIPFGFIEAHNLFNIRVGLIDSGGNWDIYFWGKNITGKNYLSDSFRDFFNTYTEQRGDKKSYGAEVNYYF